MAAAADTLHPFHLDLYLSHQIPLPFPQMVLMTVVIIDNDRMQNTAYLPPPFYRPPAYQR